MTETMEAWIQRQTPVSRQRLRAAISRTDLVHERPGFARSIRPAPGSVLASPLSAHYDPDPDYFFHWFRDAAVVVTALRADTGTGGPDAADRAIFSDIVHFNAALSDLDGRKAELPRDVAPDHRRFLRERAELDAVCAATVVLEARVEADGRLDITRWKRPQADGPALRALSLIGWWDDAEPEVRPLMRALISADLALLAGRVGEPSIDMWEEEAGFHASVDLAGSAALTRGADFLEALGPDDGCAGLRTAAERIEARLPRYLADGGTWIRSRLDCPGADGPKALDASVILGVLHAERTGGPFGLDSPAVLGTLARLAAYFGQTFAINRDWPDAPALGRYPGDVYMVGGVFVPVAFAAAELRYRRAAGLGGTATAAEIRQGDAVLETLRALAPADGTLPEQFDPKTGAPASARDLAWSHTAFLTAVAARRRALGVAGPSPI